MPVDGRVVARSVGELRAMLAEAGDLLAGFQRVVDATRTVVGVDGAGLTLAHEDGPPRWVARPATRRWRCWSRFSRSSARGRAWSPFAEDRVVAVEDLGRALR